jgi:hypothetical protein
MVQAIPVVTRADPTATRSSLTEGYLSQPLIVAHASWNWMQAIGTLNLEGLTLKRGELNTGGYGEGYVDRRHPHSYIHEALVGAMGSYDGFSGSTFVGRGFVPFGSDDPMVRPFEKYPVNHHLAQILERLVAVAAVRRGPVIAEVATFNGDEPLSPGSPPSFSRFGDSWASRLTVLPVDGLDVSASVARVKSPEVQSGAGLDQQKSSVVARFSRETNDSWHYALAEWAHTNELDHGERVTSLGSLLGEAALCRAGVVGAIRVEQSDRPEEEQLQDPFRTPRPPVDLSNLGVSRWTIVSASLSPPAARVGFVTGRPFVEVQRLAVAAGNPAGIFNPELRYGADRMWMLSAGVRLRAGSMHDRMGRYGVAVPATTTAMGSAAHASEADAMPGMPGMSQDKSSGSSMAAMHHAAAGRCSL